LVRNKRDRKQKESQNINEAGRYSTIAFAIT